MHKSSSHFVLTPMIHISLDAWSDDNPGGEKDRLTIKPPRCPITRKGSSDKHAKEKVRRMGGKRGE